MNLIHNSTNASISNDTDTDFPVDTSLRTFRVVVNIYVVSFLCLVGFVGNILSIIVLQKDRNTKTNTTWLLQALAVADTLYLCSCFFIQIFETVVSDTSWWPELARVYSHIEIYSWPCASIFRTITVWMVLLIAIDRYIVVSKPFRVHTRNPKHMKLAVAGIFIAAVVYNIPRFLESELVEMLDPKTGKVVLTWTWTTQLGRNQKYFLIYKVILYCMFRAIGPLIFLSIFNFALIKNLKTARRAQCHMTRNVVHHNNTTLMLVVVLVIFILCELPDSSVRVIYSVVWSREFRWFDFNYIWYTNVVTNALLTLNSALNFLIYCFVGAKLRADLKKMCWRHS